MNKLARKLNTFDATLIVMGGIIGAGIFANPSVVAQVAHTPALILSVWLLGGLIALIGGFIFAELAWRRPDSGGLYGYLRDAFHPLVAFEYGWTALLISQSGGLAAAGIVFANYFGPLVHLSAPPAIIAVSAIVILSAINCLGVREGGTTQNIIMLLKIVVIGALIAAGVFASPYPAPATMANVPPTALWAMIGAALIPVLFAYDGWQTAPFVDHELRNAGRAMPFGMIWGVSAVVALYVVVTLVGLRVLGAHGLAATTTPASDIMRMVFGTPGQRIVAVGIALSTLGFLSNNILTSPRIYFAMARDGLFFRSVGSVHSRTQAPVVAIVLQAAFACAITLWKGYYEIIGYVTAMDFVFLSLAAAAIFVFRARGVQGVGGLRVPAHPISTLFFIVAGIAVVYSAGTTNAIFTVVVLAAGAAAYYLRARFLFVTAVALVLWLHPSRALAATDVCGAEPAFLVSVHQSASDNAYGYVLHASAPRIVSGHLEIYAGSTTGYEIAFRDVELRRTVHQLYRADTAPFLRYVDYESAPLYFALPVASAISDLWVSHAKFAQSPDAECPVSPYDVAQARQSLVETLRNEGGPTIAAIRSAAPATLPMASAVPMPERTCDAVYTPPSVAQVQPAAYPQNMNYSSNGPIDVISKVLVGPDGSVADAWLFGGSGYAAFDSEGLRAASHSKYRPATFLCQRIPAVFIYIQRF